MPTALLERETRDSSFPDRDPTMEREREWCNYVVSDEDFDLSATPLFSRQMILLVDSVWFGDLLKYMTHPYSFLNLL